MSLLKKTLLFMSLYCFFPQTSAVPYKAQKSRRSKAQKVNTMTNKLMHGFWSSSLELCLLPRKMVVLFGLLFEKLDTIF